MRAFEWEAMDFDSLPWTGVEAKCRDRPLLLRFIALPKDFPRSEYPKRLNIFWKMFESDENGLPTEKEFARLETFENRLAEAVQWDKHSILVGALASNGEREFIFHTADVPGFMQRLTNMAQEEERYPITIHRYDDPDWTYFEALRIRE